MQLPYLLAVATVLVLALFLRTQQLNIQWLIDDEWHAIHKLTRSGYLSILSSFGHADYSIPLTVFYKFLADTVGLSELRMRLPMLLSGLVFCAVAIVWVERRFGRGVALTFGILIAVSPLLVNYSRNARPYMVTLLLSSVAIWALARWSKTANSKFLAAYLPCAWLASYLHLVMVPFVTAPWIVVAASAFRTPGTLTLRRVFLAALVTAFGVCILVVPPLVHDWSAISVKVGTDLPNSQTFVGIWYTWIGTEYSAIVVLALALSLLGLPDLRRARTEALMWACGLLGIIAAIVWMKPAWIQNPQTFARYMLPALPLWLLLIASGVVKIVARIHAAPVRVGTGIVLVSPFAFGTPHAVLLEGPNNFTLHTYYQFDYRPAHNPVRMMLDGLDVRSELWETLEKEPPGSLLVAYMGNMHFESYFLTTPVMQQLHRQRMVVLQTGGGCWPDRDGEAFPRQGIVLRNAVSLEQPRALEKRGVDWVVLHHYLPEFAADKAADYESWFGACKNYLLQRLGPPDYMDAKYTAFRVRPAVIH